MKRKIVESMSMEEAFRALNVKAKAKLHEGREEDYTIDSNLSICFYYKNVEDPHANADMIYEIVKKGRNWKYIDARDDDAIGNYKSAYEAIVAAIDAEYELLKEQEENPEDYGLSGNDDDLHVVLVVDQTSNISDSELSAIKAKIDLFDELFTIHKLEFTLETDNSKDESLNESTDMLPKIPAPYDKYFEIVTYSDEELEDIASYRPGEIIEEYNAKILAFVDPKDGYEDIFDSIYYLVDREGDIYVAEIQGTASGTRIYSVDFEDYGITETLNSKKIIPAKSKKKMVESNDLDPYENYIFISGEEFHGGYGGDAFEYSGFKKTADGWTFICNDGEDSVLGPYPSIYECVMSVLNAYMSPEELDEYNNSIECDDMTLFVEASSELASELSAEEIASIKAFMNKYAKLPSVKDASFVINDELPY